MNDEQRVLAGAALDRRRFLRACRLVGLGGASTVLLTACPAVGVGEDEPDEDEQGDDQQGDDQQGDEDEPDEDEPDEDG